MDDKSDIIREKVIRYYVTDNKWQSHIHSLLADVWFPTFDAAKVWVNYLIECSIILNPTIVMVESIYTEVFDSQ